MWGYLNGRNGRENVIEHNQFISPKYAIRGALGDVGMGNLIQNLEEDLLRWVGEAYEKITANTKAATIYKPVTQVAYTKNNRVKLCDGFKALQCLKLDGCRISFLYNKHRCTSNCQNSCGSSCSCCSGVTPDTTPYCSSFYLDGCWVKFSPEVADGLKVEIEAWATATDDEGYPLVIDKTTTAIQKYISWKVLHREGDMRSKDFERWWYMECRQARSWINKKTDAELRAISSWWQPPGFFLPYGGIAGGYGYGYTINGEV